jgi:hypothetical protein
MTRGPADLITSSKGPTNLESRSRSKNRTARLWSSRVITAQDVAHAGPRDRHTELAALPHDADVTPARVLPGQAKYQGNYLVVQGVGRGLAMAREGPGPSDELSVPAQQRRRRDKEGCPPLPAEQACQCAEQRPVRRRVTWPRHLASQHGQLVAEHGDLHVLFVRRRPEPEQVEHASDDQEGDLTGHPDDLAERALRLLRHQMLSLHPTPPLAFTKPSPINPGRFRLPPGAAVKLPVRKLHTRSVLTGQVTGSSTDRMSRCSVGGRDPIAPSLVPPDVQART